MSYDKYIKQLKYNGVTDRDFEHARLSLKERFKQEPNERDVIWYLLNQKAVNDACKGFGGTYYLVALFADEEGRDPVDLLATNAEISLNAMKKDKVVRSVKICTGADKSCERCRKLDGMVINIDEAIQRRIIPCRDCTNKMHSKFNFCKCLYRPAEFNPLI